MAIDFDKINDSPHLLDILIQMEDVLDSLDLYVFKNWFQGEIVDGPRVKRYWFGMTLRYPMEKMPDPRGALRLLKHGIRIRYTKVILDGGDVGKPVEGEDQQPTHWQVEINVPRRLLSDMNAGELDFYDEEVEVEDVQDAQDAGLNDESAYYDDTAGTDGADNAESVPAGSEEEENAPKI